MFAGKQLDHEQFKSKNMATIQAAVNRITRRTDIKILAVTWQGEWR